MKTKTQNDSHGVICRCLSANVKAGSPSECVCLQQVVLYIHWEP